MRGNIRWLKMSDGVDIYTRYWFDRKQPPIAILIIVHGMAEHIERYDSFASYMAEKGIYVVGYDQRGHGKTGEKIDAMGFFANRKGFDRAVSDLREVYNQTRDQFSGVPIFLLGHSMGSFVSRRYLQFYSNSIQGIILSGTAFHSGVMGKIGKSLAAIEMRRKGLHTPSHLLDRLIFGAFNKKISHPITSFDWLTRDQEEVQKYIADPYCGFVCTASFFYDLLSGIELIHNTEQNSHICPTTPMLFVSGTDDPVGGYGKGVGKVIHMYEKLGMTNINVQFYKDARHELLHEWEKDDVHELIQEWVKQQI